MMDILRIAIKMETLREQRDMIKYETCTEDAYKHFIMMYDELVSILKASEMSEDCRKYIAWEVYKMDYMYNYCKKSLEN